ncbi:MAG TPA: alpha-amylase family glycosyl hydrolase [Dongiaceae bacterium]|nr:alpha-amylase family glycosyl hydrolase [Dongiaceae bacterium]
MAMPAFTPVTPFPPPTAVPAPPPVHVIPAPGAKNVEVHYRSLADRSAISLSAPLISWSQPIALQKHSTKQDHYLLQLSNLGLPDGTFEYELMIDGTPVADPFTEEITKFGGYRGLVTVDQGVCQTSAPFSWKDELPAGVQLPNNNQMVIYEMPIHQMSGDEPRQVDLGTFEKVVFEHLLELRSLGVNALELLPIQDASESLTWGYGSRFFFAPDWNMGTSFDMRFLVKTCHQLGMRVILDIVMNHSKDCPLETLAPDWYYLKDGPDREEPERDRWGGRAFKYSIPSLNGEYLAREFHYAMGEFWIREYHIDGFRIDEFKGINNWDFIQEFRNHVWDEHDRLFSSRPFTVIAEDSWRRPEITDPHIYQGNILVDSMWNFDFRDELRRLLNHTMITQWGEPSRSDRIRNMISCQRIWNDMDHRYRDHGFTDMAQAVNYPTSHDVADYNGQRMMNFFFGNLLQYEGLANYPQVNDPDVRQKGIRIIKKLLQDITAQDPRIQAAHADALERAGSAFAITLTSVGIPMFFAGEEFADIHDLDYQIPDKKMTDPVDWNRRQIFGHQTLQDRVRELVTLRTNHPALQRNEVSFFYFHPTIDDNDGVKVFAYCRTQGQSLGSANQVIVLANCGPKDFPVFDFPNFPWTDSTALKEHGKPTGALSPQITYHNSPSLTVSLAPFQVRVFST